LEIQSKEL
jgi:hypothetical protein